MPTFHSQKQPSPIKQAESKVCEPVKYTPSGVCSRRFAVCIIALIMHLLPKARAADIIEQEAGGELLLYDLRINKAYNLNETSKAVFKACDGRTSFVDLKLRYKFTDDLIYLALDELKKRELISDDYDSPFVGMNRREVIRKVGLASLIALPVISSLVAPTGAMARSAGLPFLAACTTGGRACDQGLTCRPCINGTCSGPQQCCESSNAIYGPGGLVSQCLNRSGCEGQAGAQCCSGVGQVTPNNSCSVFGFGFCTCV